MTNYKTLVVIVSIIHLTWAGIIFTYGSIPHTTTLDIYSRIFAFPFGALSLLTAACVALYSLWAADERLRILFVLPQQFFLLLSSYGAIRAILLSQYADGVFRPWQFIAVDQVYVLVITAVYLYFLINNLRQQMK